MGDATGIMYEQPGIVEALHLPYNAEMLRIIGILGGCKNVVAKLADGTIYAGWFGRKK